MQINQEFIETHTIQAYNDFSIQINLISYEASVIVSRQEIITDVAINRIESINDQYIDQLLRYEPEIIVIGHQGTTGFVHPSITSRLSKQRIGIECMNIGAACRTYNVLLSEYRAVVAGFIIAAAPQ
jgi:uncharacterized protein